MGRSTVFEQVVKIIPRAAFQASVSRHQGDKGIRQLDSWTWFGALLFGQLTGHDSIRAIERVFGHGHSKFGKLGFSPICRSTLADANHQRPVEILQETLAILLERAQQLCPFQHGFGFQGKILALDSTIINLCLSLSPWARFRRGTAAVKLHTAIDIAGDLPEFVVITEAIRHDVKVARTVFQFSSGSTIMMDKAYWHSSWLSALNEKGVFFVTRQKMKNKFKVVESRPTNRTQGYICDQIVYQKSIHGDRRCPPYRGKLRRITYRDPETGKRLTFITNRFDLSTATICALYKARWKVELFFKTLKQNLRIKKFLGTSTHAVQTQILVALIAYVVVQMIRFQIKTAVSMPDAMAVIGTLLLLHSPISILLGTLPRTTRYPPNPQLSFNF